jgi:hypothetical protein
MVILVLKEVQNFHMSTKLSIMEVQQKTDEETQKDIQKRLEGLTLGDKWYDELRIHERLGQTEPTNDAESNR